MTQRQAGKGGGPAANAPPVDAWLRRRRTILCITTMLAAVTAMLLLWRAADATASLHRWARRPLRVAEVLDGPALRLRDASARHIEVALLGVTAEPPAAEPCRQALQDLCEDQTLTLAFDAGTAVDPPSADGRPAAYAYTSDGRLINEWLIERGLARADHRRPHPLSDWFDRLERTARARRRGLWADR